MIQGKPRDARKEQQWRDRLAAWRRSGLSVRAFCARHGLSQPSFYAWRRELAQRDAARPTFVPVQVLAEPARPEALTVLLPGGRSIRVAPGFDAATLRQLLDVLEEQPC
jgi:Transposase